MLEIVVIPLEKSRKFEYTWRILIVVINNLPTWLSGAAKG